MSKTLERIGLAAIVAALLCLCCVVSYRVGKSKAEIVTKTDTIVSVKYDTIKDPYPVYLTERVVDSVKIFLHDTTYVEVPITQKYYHKDSLYDAWVSGFLPQLDSISVYQKTETIEITRWQVKQPPRWSFGITAGPGILYDGKLHGGIGIVAGIQYRW